MSRSAWKTTVFSPISRILPTISDTPAPLQTSTGTKATNTISTTSAPILIFQNRSSYISEQRINYRLAIYNGQRWFNVVVTPERVGHRVGEFSPTRKRPIPKKKKQVKKK